jgi:hypothetical protein
MSLMDSNLSQFISDIWHYKPFVIVLVVAGCVLFVLSVIDTHRHRKKVQKKRRRPRHH